MGCNKLLAVDSIRIYNTDTNAYIDGLGSDLHLYRDTLQNSYTNNNIEYSALGVSYYYDLQELKGESLTLSGSVPKAKERMVFDFLDIPNQRYRIEIVRNGTKYIRFVKSASEKNDFSRNQSNEYTKVFACETHWLIELEPFNLGSDQNFESVGTYDTDSVYAEGTYGNSGDTLNAVAVFTAGGVTPIYWTLEGTGIGEVVEILINGSTIASRLVVPENTTFTYSNIPFYRYVRLNGANYVSNMVLNSPVFEVPFKPQVQNSVEIKGLKDITLILYQGVKLI